MRRRGFLAALATLPFAGKLLPEKPRINMIGTRTGRLSCKKPNLSNIPRPDPRRLEYLFNLHGGGKISDTCLLDEVLRDHASHE
jgi:hypothetical protein